MNCRALLIFVYLFIIPFCGCNKTDQKQDHAILESHPQIEKYLSTNFNHKVENNKIVYIFIPSVGCHGCIQSMLINAPNLKQKKDKSYEVKIGLLAKDQGAVNMIRKKHPTLTFDFIDVSTKPDTFGMNFHFPTAFIFENQHLKKYYTFNAEQSDSAWQDMIANLK
jgi:hypothetical protein